MDISERGQRMSHKELPEQQDGNGQKSSRPIWGLSQAEGTMDQASPLPHLTMVQATETKPTGGGGDTPFLCRALAFPEVYGKNLGALLLLAEFYGKQVEHLRGQPGRGFGRKGLEGKLFQTGLREASKEEHGTLPGCALISPAINYKAFPPSFTPGRVF